MPDPYVGELRLFAGTFAPSGWALCQGQLVPISESDMLFNLIGTTYGGDGQNNFALPDLRGRVPVHQGQGPGLTPRTIGQSGGSESVTLQTSEVPVHTHTLFASTAAASGEPLSEAPLSRASSRAIFSSISARSCVSCSTTACSAVSVPSFRPASISTALPAAASAGPQAKAGLSVEAIVQGMRARA